MTLSDDIATFIHRSPGKSIAVMVALTLVFGSGLYNFTMTMDVNDMLPKTGEVDQLRRIQEEFFDTELVAVVTRGEPVLSPTYFTEVSAIVGAWAGDAKVREGLAGDPLNVIVTIPTTLAQYDLMSEGVTQPTLEEALSRARSYSTSGEIETVARTYINDPNIPAFYKDSFWLLLPTDTPRDLSSVPRQGALFTEVVGTLGTDQMTDLLLRMEDLAKENTDEVRTYMYSDGLLGHYMAEAERQMEPIFLVLVFVLLGILLLAFRRLSDTWYTMVSLLVAVLWQIGMISWLGYALDLFQFMVPLLLLGLGVDFSLHLIICYREGLSGEGTDEERLERAVRRVFRVTVPALALATVTTMVGFGSNMIFDYPAVFKFGLGATLGILSVLLVNLFLVLPYRVLRDRRSPRNIERGAIAVERIDREPGPWVRTFSRTLRGAPVWLALLVLLAIPGLIIAPSMKGAYDPRDELIEDQDLSIAATTLMEDFSMGTETMYLRAVDDWTDAGAWQRMYAALDELSASEHVSKADGQMVAVWAGPMLSSYALMDPGLAALWANVTTDGVTVSPDATPQDLTLLLDGLYAGLPELASYVQREDGTYASMLVAVPTRTNWGEKGLELREEAHDALSPRFEKYQVTGVPIVWGVAFDQMTLFMIQSIIIVVVFAFGFLIAINTARRRDPVLGIITGLPPIIVLGWLFLAMWALGIPLNMMTSMVGAIIIGLGIDYPIHIVNRWVHESGEGHDLRGVYNITLGSTGREIVFSGITTLLALGAFFLLPMESMRVFGQVLAMAIFFAMCGALVLTPLMLRFWSAEGKAPSDAGDEGVQSAGK